MRATLERRRWGMGIAMVLLGVLAGNSPAVAADPVKDAVKQACRTARLQNVDSILLIVRLDSQSVGDADTQALLKSLVDGLQALLEAENLLVVVGDTDITANGRCLTPAEVATIADAANADAVFNADYRRKNSARQLRMNLLNAKSSLWTKAVLMGSSSIGNTTLASSSRRKTQTTAASSAPSGSGTLQNGTAGTNAQLARLAALALGSRQATTSPTAMFSAAPLAEGTGVGGTTGGPNLTPGSDSRGDEVPTLNQLVLQFALDHLGEQVGNGECWTLADEALRAAGARLARGYVFGKPIEMSEILPGDILQFTSARFETGDSWILMGMPNHTAIVQAVTDKKVHVLHQNFGQKIVTSLELDFSTMVSGEVQAFRPQPLNGDGEGEGRGGKKCRKGDGGDDSGEDDSGDTDSDDGAGVKVVQPLRTGKK